MAIISINMTYALRMMKAGFLVATVHQANIAWSDNVDTFEGFRIYYNQSIVATSL